MTLFPISEISVNPKKIKEIEEIMKSTLRLITFSRKHLADDLLNTYLDSSANLQELLSIKNAQMEAQDDFEAEEYLKTLNKTLKIIIKEIKNNIDFESEIQLFQLFRSISPDAHQTHPNKYRNTDVQIGKYLCPPPNKIQNLVADLFYNTNLIKNPLIKAIYFHHELIRIHPFIDGNGRTTRIAKNWILMYNLFPPIFIRNDAEKKEYISTLSDSFYELDAKPKKWNNYIENFFDQELNRLKENTLLIYSSVKNIGEKR